MIYIFLFSRSRFETSLWRVLRLYASITAPLSWLMLMLGRLALHRLHRMSAIGSFPTSRACRSLTDAGDLLNSSHRRMLLGLNPWCCTTVWSIRPGHLPWLTPLRCSVVTDLGEEDRRPLAVSFFLEHGLPAIPRPSALPLFASGIDSLTTFDLNRDPRFLSVHLLPISSTSKMTHKF